MHLAHLPALKAPTLLHSPMQHRIGIHSLEHRMKLLKICLTSLVSSVAAIPSANASVPYNRDQRSLIVTHVGTGAGGADESRLQTVTLGMTTIGFGSQISAGNSIADDVTFTIPTHIDTLSFYAYQTGSTTTPTFTDLRIRIWDAPPNQGGAVVFGDFVTNRFGAAAFGTVYRVTEPTPGNSTRPIMTVTSTDLNWDLNPGTYWIEVSFGGSLASGPWAVPITIAGQAGETGANGLQCIFDAGSGTCAWNNALDGGTGTPHQGFPISITGTQADNANLFVSIDDQRTIIDQNTVTTHDILVANPGPSEVIGARLQTSSSNYTALNWTCTPTAGVGTCPSATGTGELDVLLDLPVGAGLRFTADALSAATTGVTASRSASIATNLAVIETDHADNTASDNNDIVADAVFDNGFEDTLGVTSILLRDILGLDHR